MKYVNRTGLPTILLLLVMFSCQKNITVKPPTYTDKVSIQCFIEEDSIPILYFNKTVPYFDAAVKKNQLVIRGAHVLIESTNTSDLLLLDSVFDKVDCQYNYFYIGSQKILPNTTYNLTITNGTEIYKATATTDILPASIDSITYTAKFNDINGEHEGVIVYFKDNVGQDNYFRYELLRYIDSSTKKAEQPILSACLNADSVQVHELGRAVYNDIGLQGQQIKIVAEPGYSHKQGTTGLVFIQAIDKAAFDFFDQLDKQKLAASNPFVESVFIKPGQFGDKAIGFFSAKKNSVPYLFYYPE
ncbi:MAG: DUF4249 family protein [Bacteroidetes bacterium]|nr:DUF4249 family protein [Bacteroidota bacterium]